MLQLYKVKKTTNFKNMSRPSEQKSGPTSAIAKEPTRKRPQRAAAVKFLNELATYRQLLENYNTAHRKYVHDKKTNANAVPPKKPKIPVEYYQTLTGDDDEDETSDEEFHATGTEEDEEDDDDFDDDEEE